MSVEAADRVRAATAPPLNSAIDAASEASLVAASARPEAVETRLRELGHEWDFDRVLEAEAAVTGLLGVVLAAATGRLWAVIPGFAAAMVLLHSLAGPYPLLPLFRRLGLRTEREINRERYALNALRGDFESVPDAPGSERARAAWRAVNL